MMAYTTNEIDKVFKSYVEGWGMAQIEFPQYELGPRFNPQHWQK